MAEFVTITEDKFKNKTSYQNSKHLSLEGSSMWPWTSSRYLNFRRIVQMPDHDSLVMDIEVEAYTTDWPQLSEGNVILLIDGESVTLEPEENWHDCKVYEGNTTYKESCYYALDKDLLKRICDSKSFAIKLYGGTGSGEVENVNAIVVYAKLFYNAVYDNTAYKEVVANALGEFTSTFADTSKFSKIALDGTGANGGCMGVLLLLVTMAGGLLGGLCSLI